MLYAREIDDSVIIQLIILYALSKAKHPINKAQLDKLVLENCIINFVDYSIAIENLEKLNYIHEIADEGVYRLTDDGLQAVGFFKEKIPGYVRESIKESVSHMFREERKKNSVKASLLPYSEHEFMAKCVISEGDKPLMNLEFYAGTREEAKKVCSAFKKNSDIVYQAIIRAFNEITENI